MTAPIYFQELTIMLKSFRIVEVLGEKDVGCLHQASQFILGFQLSLIERTFKYIVSAIFYEEEVLRLAWSIFLLS